MNKTKLTTEKIRCTVLHNLMKIKNLKIHVLFFLWYEILKVKYVGVCGRLMLPLHQFILPSANSHCILYTLYTAYSYSSYFHISLSFSHVKSCIILSNEHFNLVLSMFLFLINHNRKQVLLMKWFIFDFGKGSTSVR